MVEAVDKTPVISKDGERKYHLGRRIALGGLLGSTSIVAYHAQQEGQTSGLPDVNEAIAESMAHPGVGYLGALATELLVKFITKKGPNKLGLFVGATVANTAIELGQDIFKKFIDTDLTNDGVGWFFEQQNWGESIKDYGFALAGLSVYMLSESLKRKRAAKN